MDFVVDRSKWRCGSIGDNAKGLGNKTYLLNKEGFMCCLGHCELQLGRSKKIIFNKSLPSNIFISLSINNDNDPFVFKNRYGHVASSDLSHDAVAINDDYKLTTPERERKLKELFKKHGHTIKFIGKSVKYKK